MRVYLTTRLTPPVKLYDADSTGESAAGKMAKRVLAPKVIITDKEGRPLYELGEDTQNLFPLIFWGAVLLIARRWL